MKFAPNFMKGHDPRGSTFGAATAAPNTWSNSGLGGSWTYGAEEARIRTILDLGYNSRTYDNNRSITTAYDSALTSVGGTVYFRVMPATSLLLNAKRTGINYKDSASLLDGSEQRFMTGLKWDATAQTTGEIKVGQLQKKYDSSTLTSYTGAIWEGAVRWSPVSYVNVDVFATRSPVETTLAGSKAINIGNTGMNVAYDLNDRVKLSLSGSQVKEDFIGLTRVDTTNNFGLKADYKIRNWLIGSAGYTNAAKTSPGGIADYKRGIFAVGVRSAL